MSVEYGTIALCGVVFYDDEAKKIEELNRNNTISDDDWEEYFQYVNGWGIAADGIVFGLLQYFDSEVCVIETDDIFSSLEEIKEFEQKMKDKPWFKEIEWNPKKYIVNYCY